MLLNLRACVVNAKEGGGLLVLASLKSSAPSPAREARRQQWPYGAMRASEDEHSANKLLAGQENSVAQPKTDKWFSFSLHFSSFLTVFKHTVV